MMNAKRGKRVSPDGHQANSYMTSIDLNNTHYAVQINWTIRLKRIYVEGHNL